MRSTAAGSLLQGGCLQCPLLARAAVAWLVIIVTTTTSAQVAFHGRVDLVHLDVSVSDSAGHHVSDLTRDEFVVLEDGVPQSITHFTNVAVPLAMALLLDSSSSMHGSMAAAQTAAIGFTRTLRPDDLAAFVDFDSSVHTRQSFTNDAAALEASIRSTSAGGSTALFNALYIALKEFSKLAPSSNDSGPRRRAIILLSDGDDTTSLVSFDDVLELAARADTAIYAIGLGLSEQGAASSGALGGHFVLRRLAEQTGGRAFFPRDISLLNGIYGEIRGELASQYSMAYAFGGVPDGRWHRLAVRLSRPGLVARSRQGYLAPKHSGRSPTQH
jgi:Ca-activated chloride channel family protein